MNRLFRISLIVYGASALLLASCAKNETGGSGRDKLTFNVSVARPESTKGVLYNSEEELRGVGYFLCGALKDDGTPLFPEVVEPVYYSDGKWDTSTPYYWERDKAMAFVGVASDNFDCIDVNQAEMSMTYNVPVDAADQTDIMVSIYQGDGNDMGLATLQFAHSLTAVRFTVGDIFDDEPEEIISVGPVYLGGVYGSGLYTFDLTEGAVLTPSGAKEVYGAMEEGVSDNFLLLPQDLSTYPVTVTIQYTTEDGTRYIVGTLSSAGPSTSWEPGKIYTYEVSGSSEDDEIKWNCFVYDWVNGVYKEFSM